MEINNQIKEIEKGCGKDTDCYGYLNKEGGWKCGERYLDQEIILCSDCKPKLKLLKQFQKEIKELQEELKKERPMKISLNEFVDMIFKKRFGEMK